MNHHINYILHLADNALILSQRNSEWCGHGPILEQDIAITNISLDLLGQARNFYQYAAELINKSTSQPIKPSTEDLLAYLRTEREFKNCLLVEQPNGDWGQTILRQHFFSTYQFLLYQKLQQSKDGQLAAIAAKALKEVTYHVQWCKEWVVRLGNGTAESHSRMLHAIDALWSYTGELFENAEYELHLINEGISVDVNLLKNEWQQKVNEIFSEATLPLPEKVFMHTGGKQGIHTEYLGFILTELQYMQKTYPGCEW
ncbi:MAG: phenylacetate-CoA oxygenase subunit PaaC [Chitinophagaceae bacterium]|nr:phenylacetate-CoA oxygenase subunit PaaC [Chitinophagaceae bacterium]